MIHFTNNFISSKVHAELVEKLSATGEHQSVLVPIRNKAHYGVNKPIVNNSDFFI